MQPLACSLIHGIIGTSYYCSRAIPLEHYVTLVVIRRQEYVSRLHPRCTTHVPCVNLACGAPSFVRACGDRSNYLTVLGVIIV